MSLIFRQGRTIAAAAVLLGALTGASLAAPMPVQQNRTDSSIIEVRNGCGPGFRYSYNRGGCVPDRGPPPPAYYPGYRPPPPAYYPGYRPPPPRPPICPPGQRYSRSFGACVWR